MENAMSKRSTVLIALLCCCVGGVPEIVGGRLAGGGGACTWIAKAGSDALPPLPSLTLIEMYQRGASLKDYGWFLTTNVLSRVHWSFSHLVQAIQTRSVEDLELLGKNLVFTTLALALASAATNYRVTLFQPSLINGTELKPGEYKIELKDNKAVVKGGKSVVEADVKVESAGEKFSSTSVRYTNADGKYKVQEIRLGGTNSKIVFNN